VTEGPFEGILLGPLLGGSLLLEGLLLGITLGKSLGTPEGILDLLIGTPLGIALSEGLLLERVPEEGLGKSLLLGAEV